MKNNSLTYDNVQFGTFVECLSDDVGPLLEKGVPYMVTHVKEEGDKKTITVAGDLKTTFFIEKEPKEDDINAYFKLSDYFFKKFVDDRFTGLFCHPESIVGQIKGLGDPIFVFLKIGNDLYNLSVFDKDNKEIKNTLVKLPTDEKLSLWEATSEEEYFRIRLKSEDHDYLFQIKNQISDPGLFFDVFEFDEISDCNHLKSYGYLTEEDFEPEE